MEAIPKGKQSSEPTIQLLGAIAVIFREGISPTGWPTAMLKERATILAEARKPWRKPVTEMGKKTIQEWPNKSMGLFCRYVRVCVCVCVCVCFCFKFVSVRFFLWKLKSEIYVL